MTEKYDVVDLNRRAGGGEYPTQDGFGWTNGVALALVAQGCERWRGSLTKSRQLPHRGLVACYELPAAAGAP
jgi:hypothetical protein